MSDTQEEGPERGIDADRMSPEELTAFVEAALDRLPVPDLIGLRNAAEVKRQEKLEGARHALRAKWRAEAADIGLTPEEVLRSGAGTVASGGTGAASRKRRKDAGSVLPVKYRGPQGQTWSGRGRPPRWLQELKDQGRGWDEFRATEEEG